MKTIFELPAKGCRITVPGGYALRADETNGTYVVEDFDVPEDGPRNYHHTYRTEYLSDALEELARRVRQAEDFKLSGALDTERGWAMFGQLDCFFGAFGAMGERAHGPS